jgi:hypothetical protein
MRGVVVYESMFGNTHEVAEHIAEGLRSTHTVTVVSAGAATPDVIDEAEFLVVGGPTHAHGLSRESSRQQAVEKDTTGHLDPSAAGPGVREWLETLGEGHVHAAVAFDTRIDAPVALTGRASKAISKRLAKHGYWIVADPESFLVDRHNHLLAGEAEHAAAWGAELATVLTTVPAD